MRVLFLTGEYPPDPGSAGIGALVADTAEALVGAGHEPHVLDCAPGMARADVRQCGVHVHRRSVLPLARALRGRTSGRLALAWSHRVHARSLGPFDVVEAPDWQAQGLGFAWRGTAPLVVCLHTPDAVVARQRGEAVDRARFSDRLEAWTARRAAMVTAPSHLVVDELRSLGWLAPDIPVVVALPPLDLDQWRRATDASTTAPVVAGVGRLERRKGFDSLIRAVALVQRTVPDVRLAIVGPDPDGVGPALTALASRLGVPLALGPPRPRDALARFLADARVVAVPSHFESLSMVALESMAMGRPVVCTDRVGLAEWRDATDAITVTADDPQALAAGLTPLLVDADRAAHAGEHARRLVHERCAPREAVAARIAIYEQAIARVRIATS